MKYQSVALAASTLASGVAAFPAIAEAVTRGDFQPAKRQGVPDGTPTFNAKQQYVSTSGVHKFVAPGINDARGPCPGLNAMANHGYLPHNGVGSHLDFVTGTYEAFGMAADLSGFLTVLGATLDGNGLTWSIGGPNKAESTLGGLLGVPQGISGSHNKYEGDASPSRGDLYLNGDDFTIQMDQYQQLYDMAIANGDDIDLDLLNDFRSMRFDHSVQNNPYFFNGPFTGVLVAPAAFEFIYRFMGNKSAEYPAGKLNTKILNSFFGIKKSANGKLTKMPGMERFPEDWYKRAHGDEYSIPYLNSDTLLAAAKYPKFLTIGGNVGKTNSLVGIDPANITGGVYNAQMLTQGNNLACFASEFATQVTPDLIKCGGVISDVTGAMKKLTSQFETSFGTLGCPKLTKPQTSQFKQFPGYKNLNCKTGKY